MVGLHIFPTKGIVIASRELHPENKLLPIFVTLFGITISVSLEQLVNA